MYIHHSTLFYDVASVLYIFCPCIYCTYPTMYIHVYVWCSYRLCIPGKVDVREILVVKIEDTLNSPLQLRLRLSE